MTKRYALGPERTDKAIMYTGTLMFNSIIVELLNRTDPTITKRLAEDMLLRDMAEFIGSLKLVPPAYTTAEDLIKRVREIHDW